MPRVALDFAVVNPQGIGYRSDAAREKKAAARTYTRGTIKILTESV